MHLCTHLYKHTYVNQTEQILTVTSFMLRSKGLGGKVPRRYLKPSSNVIPQNWL